MTFSYLQTDAKVGMFEYDIWDQWWRSKTNMKIGRVNLNYKPHEKLDVDVNFEYNTRDTKIEQFMLANSDFLGNITTDEEAVNLKAKVGTDLLPSNRFIAGLDYQNADFAFGKIYGPIVSGPDKYDLRETAVYLNDKALMWDAKVSHSIKLATFNLTGYLSLYNITSKKLGIAPFQNVPGRWLSGGMKFEF